MATVYRVSYRNPQAQRPAVGSLGGTREKPDTSSDAALAAALAEQEAEVERMSPNSDTPTSPSGVAMSFPLCDGARTTQQAAVQPRRLLISDGIRHHQQLVQRSNAAGAKAGVNPANQTINDAELARRLQDVEIKAVSDAQDKSPSLLFPDFLRMQSDHELALSATLSRAHSVKVTPASRCAVSAPLLPEEPEVVSADRQRLLATLALYDLQEREVAGDGNCQFRSLSDQLYGTPDYHDAVRAYVVAQLRKNASSYSCYVLGEYDEYCSSMANSGTWGDHVTLQAASDHFGVPLVVVTSFSESPVINIQPATCLSPRTLYLAFWAEVHYNSLYAARQTKREG